MYEREDSKVTLFEKDAYFFFKVGRKHADRRQFDSAYKYLGKAVEMEPENAEYLFNLACVLAELKELRKSNKILSDILKNLDPGFTECYFGMGCNHFSLGNYNKSESYFKKYIDFAPNGTFAKETLEILYYLEIFKKTKTGTAKTGKPFLRPVK